MIKQSGPLYPVSCIIYHLYMRYHVALLLSFTTCLLLAANVFALDLGQGLVKDAAKDAGYDENTTETTFAETVGTVIKAVLSLVGVVFTFLMAYAGNMWLTARGDETEIEKAKKLITGAIMGLVITLAAYTLSNFAVNALIEKATGG